jgi:sugar phosphate isomerase/epimerase
MAMSIGLNLFSVFKELNEDYFGTLEKVAEMGYKNVELISSNFSTGERYTKTFSVPVIKKKLDELGLHAFAAHEGVAPGKALIDGDWDKIIDENAELGCSSIVMPMAFINSREDTLQTAKDLNSIGEKCKGAGLDFYYHNHAHEFKRVGDQSLFDLLVENTDPDYVKFELDLVWVTRGGYDPIALLETLGARCDMIHQKDLGLHVDPVNIFSAIRGQKDIDTMQIYKQVVKPTDFVNLGTGIVDFDTTYQKINEMGIVKYAIVENEGSVGNKLTSIASDLDVMEKYVQGYINADK